MLAGQHLHHWGPLNFTNLKEPFILWVNFANNASVIRFQMQEKVFFFSCCSTFIRLKDLSSLLSSYCLWLKMFWQQADSVHWHCCFSSDHQGLPFTSTRVQVELAGLEHWCISPNKNSWKWLFQMRATVVIVAAALLFIMGLWPHKMTGKLHRCTMAV